MHSVLKKGAKYTYLPSSRMARPNLGGFNTSPIPSGHILARELRILPRLPSTLSLPRDANASPDSWRVTLPLPANLEKKEKYKQPHAPNSCADDDDETLTPVESSRINKRMANRMSVEKCRKRKRVRLTKLEVECDSLEKENSLLRKLKNDIENSRLIEHTEMLRKGLFETCSNISK